MYETPQTFAGKAAIIEVLKRACGAPLTRGSLLDAASRELHISADEDLSRALDELELEEHIATEVVDGVERVKLATT